MWRHGEVRLGPGRTNGDDAPAPAAGLQNAVASLRQQRTKQATFVIQNTRAIVKSAASRRGLSVSFTRPASRPLPDRTSEFQDAVRDPTTVLRSTAS